METETVQVQVAVVELTGGRRVSVSRFRSPSGRDVVTISEGWDEDGPMPGRRGEAVEVPGDALGELIEALQEVQGGAP